MTTKLLNQNFGKRQLIGSVVITALVVVVTIVRVSIEHISPSYAQGHITVSYDGSGRRGILALWLLLVIAYSLINLGVTIVKFFKRSK